MTSSQLPTAFAPAERASPEEVRTQSKEFAELPARWALDAVPDIFLILNMQRQIVFANQALLDLLGVKDGDFVNGLRPGEALNCIHARETEGGCGTTESCSACGAVQAILASQAGQAAVQECRVSRKDGKSLDLLVWATPVKIKDKQYSIFTVKDISHEKRRRALERIFFHDILNTAGGVRGYAELLRYATMGELDELKQRIYLMADRLIDEINSQRELISAENDELTVHVAALESLGLIQDIAALCRSHPAAEERLLVVAPDAEDVVFASDGTLLRRVIGNMVKNALEASQPGETVTLGSRAIGRQVEFWVHNPAFMPRQVQLQVFQRSFSTKGEGRGLGTYSMQLLSERYLMGQVSFMSSPQDGTTFKARYPLMLDARKSARAMHKPEALA